VCAYNMGYSDKFLLAMGTRRTILTVLGATIAMLVLMNVLFQSVRGPDLTRTAAMIQHHDWYRQKQCEDVSESCTEWCVHSTCAKAAPSSRAHRCMHVQGSAFSAHVLTHFMHSSTQ
jgi:hypothetical protein